MASPRLSALVAEGVANARAGRSSTVLRIVVAVGLAIGAAVLAATTTTRAQDAAAHQVLAGRNAIRVLGAANAPVTAASCDSLNVDDAVRFAGGLTQSGAATLANGVSAPRVLVTPGFVRFLEAGRQSSQVADPSVVVGSAVAKRAGVRTGATVTLDGIAHHHVVVLPDNVRTTDWSSALLVVEPPTGSVDECWVEFTGAPTEAADRLLVMVDGPRPLVTGPLDASAIPPTPAETTARTLTPSRIGLGAALPLLLLTTAVWWARRSDWALYSTVGFTSPKITLIAATEWLLTCLLPFLVGASWGWLLSIPGDGSAGFGGNVARSVAVALLGASLSLAWLRAFTARMRTRSLLAGM